MFSCVNVIIDWFFTIKNFNQIDSKKKCQRIPARIKKQFIQQVVFYATNQYPSILQIIKYSCRKRKQYLFVESKEYGILDQFISNLQKKKQKLIQQTS